jgi:hypothetical protein
MVTSRFVFIHLFFDYYRYLLSKRWNSLSCAWVSSMSGNWWVGCEHGRICWPLRHHLFEVWKGGQGGLHSRLHLSNVPYIDISFPCMFLEMNSWWAQMWKMYVPHNCWLDYKKTWILFVWGLMWCQIICSLHGIYESKLQAFNHFACMVVKCPERILGIIGQDPSVSKANRLNVVIFMFTLLDWGSFYTLL